MIVVFVNCDSAPFVDRMIDLSKLIETRTRDTLRSVMNQRVFIAETHRGRRPVVRCSLIFGGSITAYSREAWETVRGAACIPAGSRYDWQDGKTKKKVCYFIEGVRACEPFTPPEGVRHGYVYMECNA